MLRRPLALAAGLGAALALVTGCTSNEVLTFPEIQLEVNEQTFGSEGATVAFPQALQTTVTVRLQIRNVGSTTLNVASIGWAVDETTGAELVNPYVSADFPALADFPLALASNDSFGVTIDVRYTPPVGGALDDFSPSRIEIISDARESNGLPIADPIVVEFTMPEGGAIPLVNPTNYKFQNATPTKPETATFTITNDPDLATAPFVIQSVTFLQAENEFTLLDIPNVGTVVPAPSAAVGLPPATFKVRYTPVDDGTGDEATVVVTTDVGQTFVQLTTGFISGSYSLSFSHVDEFDFTNVNTTSERCVNVMSEGPGPITVKEPRIEPNEAKVNFAWAAFRPATSPDGEPTEITSWPRGLQQYQSIDVCVTYSPKSDGTDDANGRLVVPYESPEQGDILLDLFAGDPKPKLSVAPASGNVFVSASVADGDTGSRKVVLYNEGNGALDVNDVFVEDAFGGASDVFSLTQEVPFVVPPRGVHVLDVDWDAAGGDVGDSLNDALRIVYFNPFTGVDETEAIGLVFADRGADTNPSAVVAVSGEDAPTAGLPVTVNGFGSEGGSFEIDSGAGYLWYLTGKPELSRTVLNEEGGPTAQFLPDVAGDYTVELVTLSSGPDSVFLFSEPGELTITVVAGE